MTEFTPILSLSGGVLIGLSAAAAFFLFGRVLGMTGIVARTLDFDFGEGSWRPLFLDWLGGHAIGAINDCTLATWL